MDRLQGIRVFLVEDAVLLLLEAEDNLSDLGAIVAAKATTFEAAMDLADTVTADVAVLDLDLEGVSSVPVAAVLASRRIPVVFMTGFANEGLPDELVRQPVVAKPCSLGELGAAVRLALDGRAAA